MYRAGVVAQHGFAQRHLLDRPLHAGNPHRIADVIHVLDEDKKAVDYVVDQRLRTKSDGQTDDAGAGQQGLHVDIEDRQSLKQREKINDEYAYAVNDGGQGTQLLGTNASGKLIPTAEIAELARQQTQQSRQNQSYDQDHQHPWQPMPQPIS